MAIRIESVEGAKLRLSGDIHAVLDLPVRAAREGFGLAFSDGTLVRGGYDKATDRCRFSCAIEGAGLIAIARKDDGDVLDIGWRIEWISLASGDTTLCPSALDAAENDAQLSLTIGMRDAA